MYFRGMLWRKGREGRGELKILLNVRWYLVCFWYDKLVILMCKIIVYCNYINLMYISVILNDINFRIRK